LVIKANYLLGFRAKGFIGFKAFKGAYLGNIPSNYVIYLLSIYISINFCILGQFCDLGVPRLPRAIRYYITLVIGREGKWQSPLMASEI
jgi:hypothetical protein